MVTEIQRLTQAKDSAYAERNKCVVGLAIMAQKLGYPAFTAIHPIEDESWEDVWRTILVIELPTGQVTWHFHDSEKPLLTGLPSASEIGIDYKWDGHTTEEKYKRLLNLSLDKNSND